MNNKGCDLPVWPLWVNIDYTPVRQLSEATRAEHSHVLWHFFTQVISALIPASALFSPQSVHFSLLCIYQHVWLCTRLRFPRAPAWCSQTFTAVHRNKLPQSFGPRADWLTPKTAQKYLSSHVPHPHRHACHQTQCAHLSESALLTSFADKQDLTSSLPLSSNHWAEPWNRIKLCYEMLHITKFIILAFITKKGYFREQAVTCV